MDIPKIFTISESAHRIHNPFTAQKYATLGQVLRMPPDISVPGTHVGWRRFAAGRLTMCAFTQTLMSSSRKSYWRCNSATWSRRIVWRRAFA